MSKLTLLSLLTAIFVTCQLPAQKGDGAPTPGDPSMAALKFLVLEHDFGKITDEKPVTFAFTFVNTSDRLTVNVKNVQSTCGCTAADLGKRLYAPGERGQIDVTFNPTNRRGREGKSIFVDMDDPVVPRLELKIVSTVTPRIRIEPMSVWFGEIRYDNVIGTVSPKRIQITSQIPGFEVKSISVEDKRFTSRMLKTEPVEKDGEKAVRITFEISIEENVPIGRMQSQVVVETNDAKNPKINVGLIADAVGDLRITPERLYAQVKTPAESFTQEATIVHRDNAELKLTGATVFGPDKKEMAGYSAEVSPLNPGHTSMWRVRLKGTGPSTPGQQFSGTVKVTTDNALQPEIEIPFSGMLVAAAPVPVTAPGASK